MEPLRSAAVITVSDRVFNGIYEDKSGVILVEGLTQLGYEMKPAMVVPDEIELISDAIKNAIRDSTDLIVTTGGTGISLRDVTPEATRPLLEKEIPGFMESFRASARDKLPVADLARGLVGVNGKSLIVNLPGSSGAARDGLVILEQLAHHIHDQLRGYDHSNSH